MKVATVNRELQVLRRMFALATEWGKVERVLPRVRMIPGEAHRDRVITVNEEKAYFEGAQAIGIAALEAYQQALVGIRAAQRGEAPIKPRDPFLLRDVATVLLDCGIRPEECFRLRWENARTASSKSPMARRTTLADVFPSPRGRTRLWRCGAACWKGHGSFRHPRRAATSNRRRSKASTPKRACSRRLNISRCTPSAIRA